jgi:hypothetical protein
VGRLFWGVPEASPKPSPGERALAAGGKDKILVLFEYGYKPPQFAVYFLLTKKRDTFLGCLSGYLRIVK